MKMRELLVLYIDDDSGLGRLVQKALAPRGIMVRHVETATEGLALLASQPFDVVALDHALGGETGLDIIPKIRDLPSRPPIIYVTGSDDANIAVAALKAGAVDYVWKDVQGHYRELLGQAVMSAVGQEKLKREKEEAQRLVLEAKDRAELLLAEVNHRVANSLALVAALASLQANAVADQSARTALQEIQGRIMAIAGVHRRLYTSQDVRFVELDAYIKSLADELDQAMNAAEKKHSILVETDAQLRVATDKAISLGVIVTELVTNAYKYAYPNDVYGDIRVSLRRVADNQLSLVVEDDGVGLESGAAPLGSGIGTRIINAMAMQLHSSVVYEADAQGTRAKIDFPI